MQPDAVTAHHEAAHFIVHASIGYPKAPRLEINPEPSKQRAGYYHPGDNSLQMGAGAESIWVSLAGPVAEWIYSPEATHPLDDMGQSLELGAVADMLNVRCEVERLVGGDRDLVDREIGRQFQRVHALLRRRWRHVEAVAANAIASEAGRLGPDDLAPWLGGKLPRWRWFDREFDRLWERRGRDAA